MKLLPKVNDLIWFSNIVVYHQYMVKAKHKLVCHDDGFET